MSWRTVLLVLLQWKVRMDRQSPTVRVLLERSKKQKRLPANKKSETFG